MPSHRRSGLGLCALLLLPSLARPQDVPQRPFLPDAHYFDFWAGTWYPLRGGTPDTTGTRFVVRPGPHPGAWIEEWRMRLDSVTTISAHAVRAWDATRNRWGYLWVSSQGHFQVWDGRKVGSDWYIYRAFAFPNDTYLSRQAWLPLGPGRLQRISQKSYDGGETWQLRFTEEYVRVSGPAPSNLPGLRRDRRTPMLLEPVDHDG